MSTFSLPQLTILYLGNNRLYRLPKELKDLKELNTLWLETNCFTVFPKVVCELPNLKTLHIGYNQIKSIPKELGQLEELRSIWLGLKLVIYDHNPCINAPVVDQGPPLYLKVVEHRH
uniref:Uncharacterized protein n=1 Tax=Gouania willdenowi TaxID=441366 RepID=A0A8C5GGW5_GOUWI